MVWALPENMAHTSGLYYYKHMMIINDDSSVVIKWSFKLIDVARCITYDHHMFIVQATEMSWFDKLSSLLLKSGNYLKWSCLYDLVFEKM
jgi:hypothetical protein